MQFPNAYEGVKKIYKAEILAIIAAICLVIVGILALVVAASESAGAAVGVLIFGLAAAVLAIIAFIMNIVGVGRASKDEPAFKTALYALIIGIIASIVLGAFQSSNALISGLGSTVSKVMEFLASYYICTGIINLADKLNDAAVSEKGKKVRTMLIVVWIISAVVGLISGIVNSGAVSVIGGILAIIAAILAIIAYIMYLGLLSKAKKMLEQ